MTSLKLTKTGMRQGVWEGVLTGGGSGVPQVVVTHQGTEVAGVAVTAAAEDKSWVLTVPIPRDAIADGVQTLLVQDKISRDTIGAITLITEEDCGADLRAEVDLLRAELDMLKSAFRHHCLNVG